MRLLFGLFDPLLVEVRFLHCHIGGSRGTEPFVVFVPPARDIGTDQNDLPRDRLRTPDLAFWDPCWPPCSVPCWPWGASVPRPGGASHGSAGIPTLPLLADLSSCNLVLWASDSLDA